MLYVLLNNKYYTINRRLPFEKDIPELNSSYQIGL